MIPRYTIDGSAELERKLENLCQEIARKLQRIIPSDKIVGLVLAGGYGRGQGGVLRIDECDRPYNDLEFYLFLRGNRIWNEKQYRQELHALEAELSPKSGLNVEFKIDSINRFRKSRISMFSYDLVSAHRVIIGSPGIFAGCSHHLHSESIPGSEATRLLFNRCSGLLLAREILCEPEISKEKLDFVTRNLAKAELALGDAVLTALKRYHWSCTERHARLTHLTASADVHDTDLPPSLAVIQRHHERGTSFKLLPHIPNKSREELQNEHSRISRLALGVWLWLESRRLSRPFASITAYVTCPINKLDRSSRFKNYLLNLRTFGVGAALDSMAVRYPRERLFNTLPVLLWHHLAPREPAMVRHVQKQLHTPAADWSGWVAAYRRIWPSYG